MSEKPFDEPRLAINRVYTRAGDQGDTRLAAGRAFRRMGCASRPMEAWMSLNAFLGAARTTVEELSVVQPRLAPLGAVLLRVQHELFNLGSILATLPKTCIPGRRASPRRRWPAWRRRWTA